MEIISRAEAKQLGLTHYFTGKPCKHGHVDKRFTGNGNCATCSDIKNSKTKDYRRQYHINNIDSIKSKKKIYRSKNKEKIRLKKFIDYHANKDVMSEKSKRYYEVNREQIIRKNNEYRKANPESQYVRDLIKRLFNNWRGGRNKAEVVLGYTYEEIREHLESQFTDDMSWDNYGEWHIDHVIPVSWWISQGVNDPSIVNALENLQPLWAKDNLAKGAKLNKKGRSTASFLSWRLTVTRGLGNSLRMGSGTRRLKFCIRKAFQCSNLSSVERVRAMGSG